MKTANQEPGFLGIFNRLTFGQNEARLSWRDLFRTNHANDFDTEEDEDDLFAEVHGHREPLDGYRWQLHLEPSVLRLTPLAPGGSKLACLAAMLTDVMDGVDKVLVQRLSASEDKGSLIFSSGAILEQLVAWGKIAGPSQKKLVLDESHEFSLCVGLREGDLKVWGDLAGDLWNVDWAWSSGHYVRDEVRFGSVKQAGVLFHNLRTLGPQSLPEGELAEFIGLAKNLCLDLQITLPPGMEIRTNLLASVPVLYLKTLDKLWFKDLRKPIKAFVAARYASREYPAGDHLERQVVSSSSDGNGVIILELRDIEREKQACLFLAANKHAPFSNTLHFSAEGLAGAIHRALDRGWEVWAEKKRVLRLDQLNIKVNSQLNWFGVSIATESGAAIDEWQILSVLKRRSLFVQLGGDDALYMLPEKWILGLRRFFDQRLEASVILAEEFCDWVALSGGPPIELPRDLSEILQRFRNSHDVTEDVVPRDFEGKLKPHQVSGLSWLLMLHDLRLGGCLADDMGLGKTAQVIALFTKLKERNLFTGVNVVIVPKSLVPKWCDEFKKFSPALNIKVVPSKKKPGSQLALNDGDILIASYGQVKSGALSGTEFNYIVLDEAQYVKNPNSLHYQAVSALRGQHRLVLTGTPVENHAGDLVALLKFLNPQIAWNQFIRIDETDPQKIATTSRLIRPLIVRRLKSDVLRDLPTKSEALVVLPMDSNQANVYSKLDGVFRKELSELPKDDEEAFRMVFLEGLLRLRQAACHPRLIYSKGEPESNKLSYLENVLPGLLVRGEKIVVFSQFTSFLAIVSKRLTDLGLPYLLLDGKVKDRWEILNEFQHSGAATILLASLKVGGVGIDLTAASHCFILDPWWNPFVELQASDRLHRLGQSKPVHIYRLISQNSVEEKVLALQQVKARRSEIVATTSEDFWQSLNADELRHLQAQVL